IGLPALLFASAKMRGVATLAIASGNIAFARCPRLGLRFAHPRRLTYVYIRIELGSFFAP
ncbi:MAG: hypothetical protein IKO42_02580, partial [Opitutales bacterium]|nr:hypothetical protein [Opitutales bacterium]